MMRVTNSKKRETIITKIYDNKGGLNLYPNAETGFSNLKNLYLNPSDGMLTSFAGFRKIHSFDGRIYSIFSIATAGGRERIFIHSGDGLYSFLKGERDEKKKLLPIATLLDRQSYICAIGRIAFIADGKSLLMIKDQKVIHVSSNPLIAGAKCLAIFDGRLFLSGNPSCPERIIISRPISKEGVSFELDEPLQNDEVGDKLDDVFNKADSNFCAAVVSFLPLGDDLWVFKSHDFGDGSILCYRRLAEGRYEVLERIFSLCPLGGAIAFNDEILFVTSEGLTSIKRDRDGKIVLVCRSKSIYTELVALPLIDVTPSAFGRYVVLFFENKLYLGDSENLVGDGYTWYLIEGVGSYRNDRRIYRYSTESLPSFSTAKNSDEIAKGEIFSIIDEDGQTIYYEESDGERFLVYPTGNFFGGDFFKGTQILCKGELMWFGTECGDLCLFNTDKIAELRQQSEFCKNENDESCVDYLYSFCNHPVEYIAEYLPDDGGYPNLTKDTLPNSLLLCAALPGAEILTLCVRTDGEEVCRYKIQLGSLDFSNMNFECLSASVATPTVIVIPERAHGWREKQIVLRCTGYGSPIKISSIVHSFRIKGRIKKKY